MTDRKDTEDYTHPDDQPCEECGAKDWHKDEGRGETWCKLCGMVRQDYEIDYGKDWRVFSDGEGASQERTGMPSTNLLHDKGLTTDIGWENKDYAGGRDRKSTRLNSSHT